MMFISLGIGATIAIVLILVVTLLTNGSKNSSTSSNSSNSQPTTALQGKKVASFSLAGLNGGTQVAPWSSGHPSVLIFFASWCEPCKAEMPKVAHYVATHQLGSVDVLGIDANDALGSGRSFVKKDHVTFPVAFDANGVVTSSTFDFLTLPETVFLNAKGVVESVHFGAISTSQLSKGIAKLSA